MGDRGRVHAVAGARRGRRPVAVLSERLRLWLERDRRGAGYHLRDAATGEPVARDDPRVRVVPVAGVSFRPEAVADASFDPGARLALVREPENEHDPNAVAIWNGERTLQAGYVPREVAAELTGDEVAVSLWRAGEGLRVLLAPPGSWVGRPRR
ncbi:MAG TPA: HIRAN domain-containing protein [Gaiellaceae bacterium]